MLKTDSNRPQLNYYYIVANNIPKCLWYYHNNLNMERLYLYSMCIRQRKYFSHLGTLIIGYILYKPPKIHTKKIWLQYCTKFLKQQRYNYKELSRYETKFKFKNIIYLKFFFKKNT